MVEKKKKKIKLFAMDVDGVLTDGKIYMGENGELMKAFNIKDGYAIHDLLPDSGITPAIITGRKSKIVEYRAKELGIKLVYQGIKNKLEILEKIAADNNVTLAEIAFIGDDINDFDCLESCGISGCPADAADEVKKITDFISKKCGGEGAVRDFAEYVLRMSFSHANSKERRIENGDYPTKL